MLIKELLNLKEEKDRSIFNDDQIRDIEQYLGDLLDDAVEVFSVGKSSPGRDEKGEYVATIDYDGKDEKGYRGYAYFDCHEDGGKGGRIVDFKLVDLTGVGYKKIPPLGVDEGWSRSKSIIHATPENIDSAEFVQFKHGTNYQDGVWELHKHALWHIPAPKTKTGQVALWCRDVDESTIANITDLYITKFK